MYIVRDFLKNNIFPFEEEFSSEFSLFKSLFLDKIEKQSFISYDLTFYLKNFNKEKFIPVRTTKIRDHFESLSLSDKPSFDNSFKTFLTKRYDYQLSFFENLLSDIESFYSKFKQPNQEFKAFYTAICCALKTGGPLQKKLFLASFFREHFSFERGVFRQRNIESFSSKDSLLFISNFYKVSRLEPSYKAKRIYLKKSNFAPVFLSTAESFIKKYNQCFTFHNSLKNLYLHHLNNMYHLNSLRSKFLFFKLFNTNFYFKYSLNIPSQYLTDNVYKLHFLLINDYLPELNFKRTYNRTHPLLVFSPDFPIHSFSLEELDLISSFLSTSIIFKRKDYFSSNNDFKSLIDLLCFDKKIGLFILHYYFSHSPGISNVNFLSSQILSHQLYLFNYHIRFFFEKRIYSILFISKFSFKDLFSDSFEKNILSSIKKEFSFPSLKFKSFFSKIKFNFIIRDNSFPFKRLPNSLKEQFFCIYFYQYIVSFSSFKERLDSLSLFNYLLFLNIVFFIFIHYFNNNININQHSFYLYVDSLLFHSSEELLSIFHLLKSSPEYLENIPITS